MGGWVGVGVGVGVDVDVGVWVWVWVSVCRVSDQLSAAMYNQTLPHGDEAMAETQEYHRNVAWT